MLVFTTTILKFGEQGEKTGWSYISITEAQAQQLNPGCRKSFRVKGSLDKYAIKGVALLPMGNGSFIMPFNAAMRKATGKQKGTLVRVQLETDTVIRTPPAELVECLKDEPEALAFFNQLPPGHQNYFGNWIRAAKTPATQSKRIAQAVNALAKGYRFNTMMRLLKQGRTEGKDL